MKKIWGVIVLMPFLACCILSSCNQQSGASGIDVEYLWTKEDLQAMEKRANNYGGLNLSYEVTLQLKPPFYKGPMPLKYVSTSKNLGGGMMSGLSSTILVHYFDTWRNLFIYKDTTSMVYGLPDGAIAVDNEDDYLLAECKVIKQLNKGQRLSGFELIENHYNSQGDAIFQSRFEVDFHKGFKVRELETRGKKEKEYFFLWPTGLSAGM